MVGKSDFQELAAAAKDACTRSYSPYSHFPVGAALRSADGRMFAGCNVENASYGLTVCAERSAIFSMVAAGAREIATLVVYTPTDSPVPPCGACRQVLIEFGRNADIVCVCAGEQTLSFKALDLLPHAFEL